MTSAPLAEGRYIAVPPNTGRWIGHPKQRTSQALDALALGVVKLTNCTAVGA